VRESALLPYWQPLWDWRTPPAFERQGPRFWALGFLDSAEGTIVITWMELKDRERPAGVRVEHETRSSPWSRAFQKPGGRGRFSASTVRMSLLSLHAGPLESREWCVVDLEDHSLWRISPMSISEVLSELHLPGDDRLVRVEPFYMRDPLRVGSYVGYGDALLFVGEKDKYVWRADGFETYAGNVRPEIIHGRLIDEPVPASEAAEMLSLRVRQTDSDPVRPRVEVLDPSGARVLLAHEYAPETIPAKLETALMFALSLLRMPIACAYSFLPWSDEGVDRLYAVGGAHAFDEPLILHGKRPWLLALNLMVAGLCAISLVKRMKRQGTNDAAILCCASTVILCGVIAYVYFRGLMPKRSSIAPATTQRSEARELLIQSA
jgi:hypothetical protein